MRARDKIRKDIRVALNNEQEAALKELSRVFPGYHRDSIIRALGVRELAANHRPPLEVDAHREEILAECRVVANKLRAILMTNKAVADALWPIARTEGVYADAISPTSMSRIMRGRFTRVNAKGYENYQMSGEQAESLLSALKKTLALQEENI